MADVNDTDNVQRKIDHNWDLLDGPNLIANRDRAAIRDFVEYRQENEDLSANTIRVNLSTLRLAAERADVPLLDMDLADVRALVSTLTAPKAAGGYGLKDGGSGVTQYKYCLRVFFEFLTTQPDYPDSAFWKDIDLSGAGSDVESETVDTDTVLTGKEIAALKEAADNPRDKALIAFLADTGVRKTICLNLRVGDIRRLNSDLPVWVQNSDGIGHKGVPDEPRPIFNARAELRVWINIHHEDSDNPEAPLWHVRRNYDPANPQQGALSGSRFHDILKECARNADIEIDPRRVHPHNFRHSKFTRERSRDTSDADTQFLGGWNTRMMVDYYDHTAAEDTIEKLNVRAGFVDETDLDSDDTTEQLTTCGNCLSQIDPNRKHCPVCGTPTSDDVRDLIARTRRQSREETVTEPDQQSRIAKMIVDEWIEDNPERVANLIDNGGASDDH